ncbi:MAG: ATP-binding cassette domain-containing protein [Starkeya sp.]|nr:ATP-binding cassette domain-containing protein [Starkeya sp.]
MSPQETPPAVALAGVSKAFGATRAVSDVSFTVRAGTVHALLGENGAGKSTTMKLLSGLIEPDEGTIAIDGREVRLRSPRDAHRAGIRTAFQELTLVRDLSVLDNMLIPAAPMSFLGTLRRKQVAENVAAHFARLGLAVDLHAEVGRLDLALRQKIEIARALYRQPRLLLLDEPTVGLDIASRAAVVALVRALVADEGIGVLWATHIIEEIGPGDRIVVLHRGQIRASGSYEEMRARAGGEDLSTAFLQLVSDTGEAAA